MSYDDTLHTVIHIWHVFALPLRASSTGSLTSLATGLLAAQAARDLHRTSSHAGMIHGSPPHYLGYVVHGRAARTTGAAIAKGLARGASAPNIPSHTASVTSLSASSLAHQT